MIDQTKQRKEARTPHPMLQDMREPFSRWGTPRWRLSSCIRDNPLRTALMIGRRLVSTSPPGVFTSSTSCDETGHVLVAVHHRPVGTALGPAGLSEWDGTSRWYNRQDQINHRRGIEPAVLYLLKRAAGRACLAPLMGGLRGYQIVPMPHTRGEVMLNHPSGWRGRGIAWRHEGLILALAWQAA